MDAVEKEMKEEEESEGIERGFFRFLTPDFKPLRTTNMLYWQGVDERTPKMLEKLGNDEAIFEIKLPYREYPSRIICKRMADKNFLQIGFTTKQENKLLSEFTQVFSIIISIMILIGCIIGWFMARRAMEGVQRVTDSAVSIASGDLKNRVKVVGGAGTEIENLVMAFNNMIERIQTVLEDMSEVTNSIAHDLRSPITRMRLAAERTLTGNKNIESYQEMAITVIKECDRLVVMIKTMLDMAGMDSGIQNFSVDNVDIIQLMGDAVEIFEPVAKQKKIVIKINVPCKSLFVTGNESLLQRVFSNLLDNAIKYTSEGGRITIEMRDSNETVNISIVDSGVPISSEDLPNIFKPFYRADRSRSTPGNGLGLSLARSIVEAHSGEIFAKPHSGHGNEFSIVLPMVFYEDGAGKL